MKEQKKQPELRFRGFTDDWEQVEFQSKIKLIGGATPFKDNPEYWNGNIVWLSSQEIKNKYVSNGTYTITKKAIIDNKTRMVDAGTPLIVTRSGILAKRFPLSIPTIDVAINQDIKALLFDQSKLNVNFFVAELQSKEAYILKKIIKTGTTVQSVNLPDLNKLIISVVSDFKEQEKIGDFFQKLDHTIALQQRKLELLKKMKRGYLQQMFPSTGQPTPQLRFSKFKGDWKQNKLSGIAKITMGQSPKSENYTDNPNDWILVQGNADIKNGEVYPRVWTTQVTKIAQKGDLLLSVRAPVGDVAKTKYTVVIGRGVASVKGTDFIYYLLEKIKYSGYWERISSGSTFESINSNDVKEARFYVPKEITEQKKIGNFFQKLDQTITLQQSKVEKLKILKQSYLQKLFP
ncbi:restriction endonuclease subunit S [Latilactobacillus graminis]|uniref:Type I restriction modification DNA specificity domain protein n=1 Tax=Latilactobacillus graminis DSM 20719 TaxID=1423752 RepID=A0AA89L0H4_9LACO|nr:restriction endonuclease subunit S [Latilactobacillus graminis]KRM22459.1 type I restriction modification DNA specificity domain protein [Latilactobacillus graminis DSM 20719]